MPTKTSTARSSIGPPPVPQQTMYLPPNHPDALSQPGNFAAAMSRATQPVHNLSPAVPPALSADFIPRQAHFVNGMVQEYPPTLISGSQRADPTRITSWGPVTYTRSANSPPTFPAPRPSNMKQEKATKAKRECETVNGYMINAKRAHLGGDSSESGKDFSDDFSSDEDTEPLRYVGRGKRAEKKGIDDKDRYAKAEGGEITVMGSEESTTMEKSEKLTRADGKEVAGKTWTTLCEDCGGRGAGHGDVESAQ